MDRIDLLKQRLQLYLDAESAILRGQSYKIGSRELVRADLAEVMAMVDKLYAEIDLLELKSGRIKAVTF